MVTRRLWAIASVLLGGHLGCKPAEEGRASQLLEPRVLAVQSNPAEAAPETMVTFDVLRAGPAGRLDVDGVLLDFCVQRKAIAAPGLVADACLDVVQNDALVPIDLEPEPSTSTSTVFAATVPKSACDTFGPSPPLPSKGEAQLRPVDPDTTGGYYQPVRVVDGDSVSIGSVRLFCGLAGTTQDNSAEFKRRWHANTNPVIDGVFFARQDDEAIALEESTPASVQPGERVLLAATWPLCSTNQDACGDGVCSLREDTTTCSADCGQPVTCTGAENYVLLEPTTNQLHLQRETIRVSWYVTGGTLEHDRSGRGSDEFERDAQNTWTAPDQSGDYWLLLVVRDDRGGVGWATRSLRVLAP
jgi:hypothetical protein